MTQPDTSISPRKCGFWKAHSWGKWQIITEGNIRIEQRIVGQMIVQKRKCSDCGFAELNQQEVYI